VGPGAAATTLGQIVRDYLTFCDGFRRIAVSIAMAAFLGLIAHRFLYRHFRAMRSYLRTSLWGLVIRSAFALWLDTLARSPVPGGDPVHRRRAETAVTALLLCLAYGIGIPAPFRLAAVFMAFK